MSPGQNTLATPQNPTTHTHNHRTHNHRTPPTRQPLGLSRDLPPPLHKFSGGGKSRDGLRRRRIGWWGACGK